MTKYSTRQRTALVQYLASHPDESFSASQLAERLGPQGVSLSAVYRNLGELVAQNTVCRTREEGGREALYRYAQADGCKKHLHLSCSRCGRTIHMDVPATDTLVKQVAENAGFQVDRTSTVLHGVCGDCMQTTKED